MPILHDLPKEVYYDDAPITTRLSVRLAALERSNVAPVAIGSIGGIMIGIGLFMLGWQARGMVAVVYDYRAWAVLLLIAVVCAPCAVAYSNIKAKV